MNCDPSSFSKSDRNHACVECAFFVVEFRHYVFEVVINFEFNVLSVFQRLFELVRTVGFWLKTGSSLLGITEGYLLGVAAGIVLARTFSAQFAPVLSQYGESPGFAPMLSMALLFLAGILAVGLVAHALHRMLESAFAGGIDRMLGLLAGLAKGLLFAGVIGYIAVRLLPDVQVVRESQILPPLMRFIQSLAGSLDLHLPPM